MNLEQIDTSTTAGKAAPEDLWVILDADGNALSACNHEWEVRVKMHIDCGSSAVRYIRADLAGELKP